MKAIMVMYDSLCRHYLPNYGCDQTVMPNFARLADKTVTFDRCYVGSMPCMPARREIHTGRYNFLHRSWGPVEPFDDSMPEILKKNGIYTHLASDHYHYWEDGGATYHNRYSTWECSRGQEGDPWKADLDPSIQASVLLDQLEAPERNPVMPIHHQDAVNRKYIRKPEEFPQAMTFSAGLQFLETNKNYDNWFLQIETFDPHEPFFSPEEFQALYPHVEIGREIDWPPSKPCDSSEAVLEHVRNKYFALLSMCDHYLGQVLDFMDANNMWEDTMLIVNTDHGYLLGEHQWWGKNIMPYYNEIVNTPLFIWDPRCGKAGERRQALTQTIDLAPTLLDYFGVPIPKDMLGKPLREAIASDQPVREYALFGAHGGAVNITDGRYVYMRAPVDRENAPRYEYTLMPTHMAFRFSPEELKNATLSQPFSFTKECPVLRIPPLDYLHLASSCYRFGNRLYDLANDPGELHPIENDEVELRLINAMAVLMAENDAPAEQYKRIGIKATADLTMEELKAQKAYLAANHEKMPLEGYAWTDEAKEQYIMLETVLQDDALSEKLGAYLKEHGLSSVDRSAMECFAKTLLPAEKLPNVLHMLNMAARLF